MKGEGSGLRGQSIQPWAKVIALSTAERQRADVSHWARRKQREKENAMMGDGMGSGMMLGMGLFWLLAVVVLILIAAALIKYLRK
ncbi:hypothetical protein [uncultured Jannaschia sp.]|uniref:hypothetical protein n=1 Tax=uncultured Jannaschia sp. TaxID=293347 RepID=UPI00261E6080|nr:hypothetical protein [uncultured Jannaschia sp.]